VDLIRCDVLGGRYTRKSPAHRVGLEMVFKRVVSFMLALGRIDYGKQPCLR